MKQKPSGQDAHLADVKFMLRIPLERKRVASDSLCVASSRKFVKRR